MAIFVTGATNSYFLMACILIRSLRKWVSEQDRTYILDFGLSEPQQQYLKKRGLLLERPPQLAVGEHPYFYKTSMTEFLRGDWRALVWLDGDMIAVGPVGQSIDALVKDMNVGGQKVAACQDTLGTIENFIRIAIDRGWNITPFLQQLQSSGIDRSARYYNAGFVVITSPDFVREWRSLVASIPRHTVFDQNALNLLVHKNKNLRELDRAWNLHGTALFKSTVTPDDTVIAPNGTPALLIHATSPIQGEGTLTDTVDLGSGRRISGNMRMSCNPAVKALQLKHLQQFLSEEWADLNFYGILEENLAR
jgi:hypothetical protein